MNNRSVTLAIPHVAESLMPVISRFSQSDQCSQKK